MTCACLRRTVRLLHLLSTSLGYVCVRFSGGFLLLPRLIVRSTANMDVAEPNVPCATMTGARSSMQRLGCNHSAWHARHIRVHVQFMARRVLLRLRVHYSQNLPRFGRQHQAKRISPQHHNISKAIQEAFQCHSARSIFRFPAPKIPSRAESQDRASP